MSGYIGSKASVTQVDGYNRTEADGRYVNASGDTMTGVHRYNSYLAIGKGPNNNDQITFNATPDNSGNYTPNWVGSTSAGGTIIGMPSGGNGGFQIRTLRFGTNAASQPEAAYPVRLEVSDTGVVQMPYQPSWSLQPNHNTSIVYGNTTTMDFAVTPFYRCFSNGVAVSNGRVTVPVSGKYAVSAMFRQENAQTSYQLAVHVNGSQVCRGGVWFTSQAYETVQVSRILDLSANDYIEIKLDLGMASSVNGYNDNLTFFEGYLIG